MDMVDLGVGQTGREDNQRQTSDRLAGHPRIRRDVPDEEGVLVLRRRREFGMSACRFGDRAKQERERELR